MILHSLWIYTFLSLHLFPLLPLFSACVSSWFLICCYWSSTSLPSVLLSVVCLFSSLLSLLSPHHPQPVAADGWPPWAWTCWRFLPFKRVFFLFPPSLLVVIRFSSNPGVGTMKGTTFYEKTQKYLICIMKVTIIKIASVCKNLK